METTVGGAAPAGPAVIVSQSANPIPRRFNRPLESAATAAGVRYATSVPSPQSAVVVPGPTKSASLPGPPSRMPAPVVPNSPSVS